MSERRACHLVGADRTMIRYRFQDPADEALRDRMRELAGGWRRFGYRRFHVLLRQEGLVVNRIDENAMPRRTFQHDAAGNVVFDDRSGVSTVSAKPP
ncbi:hypothetical protein jaqu_35260 [Jannaschia aquimarina]|uniref:HTH-like domain-containing protein n=1 Tax=Jannaschia aquimarina TaxID=935700 RepID=A0A0D1EFY8_9RHOB|nr:hypothetical protein jaqu_35260 [Jannaschia aquimarina]SNT42112.1 hypothetical protein SAMN05421775_11815 [Jannaschia aquimarina]